MVSENQYEAPVKTSAKRSPTMSPVLRPRRPAGAPSGAGAGNKGGLIRGSGQFQNSDHPDVCQFRRLSPGDVAGELRMCVSALFLSLLAMVAGS